MKWSMIRAKGPFAFTAIVYTILVPFPTGVSSVAPIMAMFSASARKRPRRKGICSNVSVNTLIRRRPARLYKSEVDRFQITYGSGKMLLLLMLRNGTETKTLVGIPPDVAVSGTAPPLPHEVGEYPSA